MMRSLSLVVLLLSVAACQSNPHGESSDNANAAGSAQSAPGAVSPGQPAAPGRGFHLGAAANALISQSHAQSKAHDYDGASATIERALRIEPDNPLVWLELARLRAAEGNAEQADSTARKAIFLGQGDPSVQAAAWRLVADSLRTRGRNQEASDADRRAATFAPR